MSVIGERNVPKGHRTNSEISPNSVVADTVGDELHGQPAAAVGRRRRLRFDRYILDDERGCLLAGGEEIALRPKTFSFLLYLVANPGRLVSKDELLNAVWPNVTVSEDSIVQCVTELRRVLGDQNQQLIKTVPRRGYRFEAPVSADSDQITAGVTNARTLADDAVKPRADRPFLSRFARLGLIRLLAVVFVMPVLAAAIFMAWRFGPLSQPNAPPPLSIVVLPFKTLGDHPRGEFFSEGVSSDLTTELSRIPEIFVIAHATARSFKDRDLDAREVGRALNVRYVLDGSIRQNEDNVRINAELISSETGATLWADRFDRQHDQLATWKDEVMGKIAIALNFRLTRLESERSLRDRRRNPEAFDLITQGWAMVYASKSPENYVSARSLFHQALELDPEAVNGLVGVGWTSAVMVLDRWSDSPAQDIATARAAVAKALALNPDHFVAHHVRGFLFRIEGRPDAAREAFRVALGINPNFAPSYAQLGATELLLGRPDAAIPAVKRAMRLSPRDPSLGPWLGIVGRAHFHLGKYQDAVSWLTRAVDTGTPMATNNAYFASALALTGRVSQATAVLSEFRKTMPSASIATLRSKTRSKDAAFVAQQERLFEGLRIAGLPE